MENLVKYQKISKYYENDCPQSVLLSFIPLLIAPIVKAVIFRLEFNLSFIKTSKTLESLLIPNFDISEKIGKVVTK